MSIRDVIKNKKIYVVSPHFDDAALSCGGLLSNLDGAEDVTVINVFTKAHEGPYTLSVRKFLKDSGNYEDANTLYDERAKNDAAVLSKLKVNSTNLGLQDGLFRRKKRLDPLGKLIPEFDHIYPTYRWHATKTVSSQDPSYDQLKQALENTVEKEAVVLAPYGTGHHIDHVITRRVCEELFDNVIFYSDFPYNVRENNLGDDTVAYDKIENPVDLAKKTDLLKLYKTQFPAIFPSLQIPEHSELYFIPIKNAGSAKPTAIPDLRSETAQTLNEKLINDWKELWENAANASFFNSYEWFLVCLKTYNITDYKILLCYQENKLMAILPGVMKNKFGAPVLTSASGLEHVPGSPLLVRNYESGLIKYAVDAFGRQHNIYISHVNEDLAKEIKKAYKQVLASTIAKHPYIDFSKDANSFFSDRARREVRNKMKGAGGALSYSLDEVGENSHQILQTLIAVDQGSAKKLKGEDTFSEQINIDLFKNILYLCPQFVRIAYLKYHDRPIAYIFNFASNYSLEEFHTAYLADHAKLSPGKMLLYQLVDDLSQKTFKKYEFGLGFTGLSPDVEFQYDIYYSRHTVIRLWWHILNTIRRTKQVLFHRDFFKDYEFLFRTLK